MKRKQKNIKLKQLKKFIHRHLKLTFVPHGANQYRPHLIRRYGLVAALVAIIGIQGAYNFSATGSALGVKAPISSLDLLADTNAQRTKRNLSPLRVSDELSKAAFMKAHDMLARQYWAHTAPDGTTPWHWLGVAGYNYASAGENLAKNFITADAAMTAWMSSPAHRENILGSDYTDVGFAVVDGTLDGKPTRLIVALYGKPASAPVVLGATTPTMTTPEHQSIGLMARLGVVLESMTPATFATILVVVVAMSVALAAHMHRQKLPKRMRQSWYRHHGLMKAAGMFSFVVIMVFLYSNGQI